MLTQKTGLQHLLSVWNELVKNLRDQTLMLFLDFDGTLTPIIQDPNKVELSPRMKNILRQLAAMEEVTVAIVSGRSLKDLKKRINIKGIIYAGNHGLEFESSGIQHAHPEVETFALVLRELSEELEEALRPFPGVFVEFKTFTLSVHYRMLDPERIDEVKTILLKILNPYVHSSGLVLSEGKKVWEIRPPTEWNKGTMALWLLADQIVRTGKNIFPVYIGDDQTDEDAFRALKDRGLSIKVTLNEEEATEARYSLRSPEEVLELLNRLIVSRDRKK